ncbi:hypothetical protein ABZ442_29640 [Streptomyces triculaminicus]
MPRRGPCAWAAARLVISKGAKKEQHPSPATVMRMLRDHDEQTTTATEDL